MIFLGSPNVATSIKPIARDPGWSAVADAAASGGRAAKLPRGTTTTSFKNDGFGTWTVPNPGLYDVWFRVRVANPADAKPEMTLGLWDGTARVWVASKCFAPNGVGAGYSWVEAAAGITPLSKHYVQLLVTFTTQGAPTGSSTKQFWFQSVFPHRRLNDCHA